MALSPQENNKFHTSFSSVCHSCRQRPEVFFKIIIARSCMLTGNLHEDMGVHLKWTEAQARIGIYTTSEPSGSLQNPKDRRWGRYRDEMSLLETDTTKTEQNKEIQRWMIQFYTYRLHILSWVQGNVEKERIISDENVHKYKLYFSSIKTCGKYNLIKIYTSEKNLKQEIQH